MEKDKNLYEAQLGMDWIKDKSTPSGEPDFIKDLIKAFRNKLRVNRIQKIVRIFKIDVSKL